MKFRSLFFCTLLVITALALSPRMEAAATSWTGGNAGVWDLSTNWNNSTVPDGSTAAVVNSGTANLTAGVSGTALSLVVGNSGTGALSITGTDSVLTVGQLTAGSASASKGTVVVTNGVLDVSAGALTVGSTGTGILNVNGGTVYAGSLSMGRASSTTITVSSGTLAVTGDAAIGASSANGTVNMTVSGGSFSSANFSLVGGPGSTTMGVSGGSLTASGTFALGTASSGSSTMTMSGGTINSASAVVGNNTTGLVFFSGGTWNNSGTFTIGGSRIGTMYLTNNAELNVGSGTGTIVLGSVAGSSGTLIFGPGGTLKAGVVTTGSGTGKVVLNITDGSTFTAQITGNVAVNLTGTSGTSASVVISSSNSYTGSTSVVGSKLTVNGSIKNSASTVSGSGGLSGILNGSGATGSVTVNSGGTVGGSLQMGAVTLNTGGVLSPGNSPGANSATTLSAGAGSTFLAQIEVPGGGNWGAAHPTAGVHYDQTTLTGAVNGTSETVLTLNSTAGTGTILQLSITGALPTPGIGIIGSTYVVSGSNTALDNYFILKLSDSADVISGKFARVTLDGTTFANIDYSASNLLNNAAVGTFTLGGYEWAIVYNGDDATNSTTGGNDVAITAIAPIPEPSTYALLALGACALRLRARRRK